MSSNTKIVVLRLKELIYTGVFILLGILFVVLMLVLFLPNKDKKDTASADSQIYIPGVYTTSLVLNDSAIDIEVVVDEANINSLRIVNLDEAITTMYPLIEPSFDELSEQIYAKQSLDGISYPEDSKYTSLVLLDAIETSLSKALVNSPDATTTE